MTIIDADGIEWEDCMMCGGDGIDPDFGGECQLCDGDGVTPVEDGES